MIGSYTYAPHDLAVPSFTMRNTELGAGYL